MSGLLRICSSLLLTLTFVAASMAQVEETATDQNNTIGLMIVIAALLVAPFGLIMLTSFVKLAVVLSILRNAFGAAQVPPNQVVTGIALILTIFIMAPVFEGMYTEAGQIEDSEAIFSDASVRNVIDASKRAREPLRNFLQRHSHARNQVMFLNLSQRLARRNGTDPAGIDKGDFRVLIPSFVTSQLTEAFQIGFFLFIPFLVIDLVVANILQAMGMFMMSPTLVSLPFKILLFVMVDGWVLVLQNLVLGYL